MHRIGLGALGPQRRVYREVKVPAPWLLQKAKEMKMNIFLAGDGFGNVAQSYCYCIGLGNNKCYINTNATVDAAVAPNTTYPAIYAPFNDRTIEHVQLVSSQSSKN
jgi:hypothetical protein